MDGSRDKSGSITPIDPENMRKEEKRKGDRLTLIVSFHVFCTFQRRTTMTQCNQAPIEIYPTVIGRSSTVRRKSM